MEKVTVREIAPKVAAHNLPPKLFQPSPNRSSIMFWYAGAGKLLTSRAKEPATTKGMVQTRPLRMPVMVGPCVKARRPAKGFLAKKFKMGVTAISDPAYLYSVREFQAKSGRGV